MFHKKLGLPQPSAFALYTIYALAAIRRDFMNLMPQRTTPHRLSDILMKQKYLCPATKNNFLESRVISDIRIVYENELSEKEQCALVIHNLKIRFFSKNNSFDEFFVALNLSDLEKLKETIERAIQKDKLIRDNNHELTFISIK